jgi:hypothetical protein
VAGEGGQEIGQSREGGDVPMAEEEGDRGGKADRATGGGAPKTELVIVLGAVKGFAGLAEDFLLELFRHDGFTVGNKVSGVGLALNLFSR